MSAHPTDLVDTLDAETRARATRARPTHLELLLVALAGWLLRRL